MGFWTVGHLNFPVQRSGEEPARGSWRGGDSAVLRECGAVQQRRWAESGPLDLRPGRNSDDWITTRERLGRREVGLVYVRVPGNGQAKYGEDQVVKDTCQEFIGSPNWFVLPSGIELAQTCNCCQSSSIKTYINECPMLIL